MRERVLVVDDAANLRELLTVLLEVEDDFEVVAAVGDGAQALAKADEFEPDIVLLDIAMPVMDGLQALTLIREESPGSIVVMLSAFTGSSGAVERADALGAHGYIEKSGGVPAMISDLRAVLAREFGIPGRNGEPVG
jgi:DNA-binding NarL/FixJ family response regulator